MVGLGRHSAGLQPTATNCRLPLDAVHVSPAAAALHRLPTARFRLMKPCKVVGLPMIYRHAACWPMRVTLHSEEAREPLRQTRTLQYARLIYAVSDKRTHRADRSEHYRQGSTTSVQLQCLRQRRLRRNNDKDNSICSFYTPIMSPSTRAISLIDCERSLESLLINKLRPAYS